MEQVEGFVSVAGTHSVDDSVKKIQELLATKGVKLFAVIDHSGEAASAGLSMPQTKLLIFGNPKGGTPLMTAAPSAAIDLPLKLLVWEDQAGQVWISYNSPEYVGRRHHIPEELLKVISVVESLAKQAAE